MTSLWTLFTLQFCPPEDFHVVPSCHRIHPQWISWVCFHCLFAFCFVYLFVWNRVSLCSSACPRTHCVIQTGLKPTKICTACLCLWSAVVKAYATMSSFIAFLKKGRCIVFTVDFYYYRYVWNYYNNPFLSLKLLSLITTAQLFWCVS